MFIEKWVDAIKEANNLNGVADLVYSQSLLIAVLCLYGIIGLRRALRPAN